MLEYILTLIHDYFIKSNPVDTVCTVLIALFGIFTCYKFLYIVIGFFCKGKRFPETDERFKYAYVIAARNEEKVIENLIDSIFKQTYPRELMTVFVVADNCRALPQRGSGRL